MLQEKDASTTEGTLIDRKRFFRLGSRSRFYKKVAFPMIQDIFDQALYRQRVKRFLEKRPLHPVYAKIDASLQERLSDIIQPLPRVMICGAPCYTHLSLEHALYMPHAYDLLYSNIENCDALYIPMQAHWINDLSAFLKSCYHTLKEDGVLIASLLVEGSLQELAHTLLRADALCFQGASPRISPLRGAEDIGFLLQEAGFRLITLDQDVLSFQYRSFEDLTWDLRSAAGGNILNHRSRQPGTRSFWSKVRDLYAQHYVSDNLWPLTLNVLYLTAWKPGPSQPQALAPGSGQHDLGRWFASKDL